MMRNVFQPLKLATVSGLAVVALTVSASPASAGLFRRKVVVVPSTTYVVPTQTTVIREAAPVVVAPPLETVYEAPTSVLVPSAVYPTVIERRYVPTVDTAVVPGAYVPTTAVRELRPRRTKLVYPRRVYRTYGY